MADQDHLRSLAAAGEGTNGFNRDLTRMSMAVAGGSADAMTLVFVKE